MSGVKLYNGDCLEVMKSIPECSCDSIVTDPPYGLSFMGKDWDYGVPGVAFWKEAMRVAKPGAHLLSFGGTRTYHRLACAIEDAGWEIRDCIMWVYGSGFPKSMDVSKAIDKMKGAEREKVPNPKAKQQTAQHGTVAHGDRSANEYIAPMPATPEAEAWNGWGTALKPAVEPIVVARKPFEGTVSSNVLRYGTGAINIDGCRVPTEESIIIHSPARKTLLNSGHKDLGTWKNGKGRFPANLLHDGSDEVLALFPNCGKSLGGGMHTKGIGVNQQINAYGKYSGGTPTENVGFGDSGSAARFFYCAKASSSERGADNDHPTVKPISLMRYLVRLVTNKGGIVLDPFMGSGSTGIAAKLEGCRFIGIDSDEHYMEIAKHRIEDSICGSPLMNDDNDTIPNKSESNQIQSFIQGELF